MQVNDLLIKEPDRKFDNHTVWNWMNHHFEDRGVSFEKLTRDADVAVILRVVNWVLWMPQALSVASALAAMVLFEQDKQRAAIEVLIAR